MKVILMVLKDAMLTELQFLVDILEAEDLQPLKILEILCEEMASK